MTYLVFSLDSGELVGYFALALRPFALPLSRITNSQRNRLRCSGMGKVPRAHITADSETLEHERECYDAAAILIGQLGRNFAADMAEKISGSELLDLAIDRIHDIQDLAGGGLAIVEAEDHPRLLEFYEKNGFKCFGVRQLSPSDTDTPSTTAIKLTIRHWEIHSGYHERKQEIAK